MNDVLKGLACCRKARHHGTTTIENRGWGADIPGEPIAHVDRPQRSQVWAIQLSL